MKKTLQLVIGVAAIFIIVFYLSVKLFQADSHLTDKRIAQVEQYMLKGQHDEAQNLLLRNLEIDATHERSYQWLAFIYLIKGEKEEAFKYGKHLLENSTDAAVLTDLGVMFASRSFTNMAFACFIKAQKEDNYYAEVYLELGKLYGNLEKFNQAIAVWQDGLLVAPNDRRFKDMIRQALKIKQEIGKSGVLTEMDR